MQYPLLGPFRERFCLLFRRSVCAWKMSRKAWKKRLHQNGWLLKLQQLTKGLEKAKGQEKCWWKNCEKRERAAEGKRKKIEKSVRRGRNRIKKEEQKER